MFQRLLILKTHFSLPSKFCKHLSLDFGDAKVFLKSSGPNFRPVSFYRFRVLPHSNVASTGKTLLYAAHMPALNLMNPESSAQIQVEKPIHGKKIDMTPLKDFARKQLARDSVLAEVLSVESDEVDVYTFLGRVPLYLRLSSLDRSRKK